MAGRANHLRRGRAPSDFSRGNAMSPRKAVVGTREGREGALSRVPSAPTRSVPSCGSRHIRENTEPIFAAHPTTHTRTFFYPPLIPTTNPGTERLARELSDWPRADPPGLSRGEIFKVAGEASSIPSKKPRLSNTAPAPGCTAQRGRAARRAAYRLGLVVGLGAAGSAVTQKVVAPFRTASCHGWRNGTSVRACAGRVGSAT